jgi:hypothetical protein
MDFFGRNEATHLGPRHTSTSLTLIKINNSLFGTATSNEETSVCSSSVPDRRTDQKGTSIYPALFWIYPEFHLIFVPSAELASIWVLFPKRSRQFSQINNKNAAQYHSFLLQHSTKPRFHVDSPTRLSFLRSHFHHFHPPGALFAGLGFQSLIRVPSDSLLIG